MVFLRWMIFHFLFLFSLPSFGVFGADEGKNEYRESCSGCHGDGNYDAAGMEVISFWKKEINIKDFPTLMHPNDGGGLDLRVLCSSYCSSSDLEKIVDYLFYRDKVVSLKDPVEVVKGVMDEETGAVEWKVNDELGFVYINRCEFSYDNYYVDELFEFARGIDFFGFLDSVYGVVNADCGSGSLRAYYVGSNGLFPKGYKKSISINKDFYDLNDRSARIGGDLYYYPGENYSLSASIEEVLVEVYTGSGYSIKSGDYNAGYLIDRMALDLSLVNRSDEINERQIDNRIRDNENARMAGYYYAFSVAIVACLVVACVIYLFRFFLFRVVKWVVGLLLYPFRLLRRVFFSFSKLWLKPKKHILETKNSPEDLIKWKKLLDEGVISQSDFDKIKKEMLG